MIEREILQGLDKSFVKQANIEVDKRWGKQFGASISNDYQKSITKIHSKIYHKAIVGVKIIGLLAAMGGTMALILQQGNNPFVKQIPGLGFLLLVLFIALIPATLVAIGRVANLDKVYWSKEDLENSRNEYSDWDLMSDENITNANLWDGVNIDGTPMYDGVDMNGNPYGVTDD